jgi:hypothetical protein
MSRPSDIQEIEPEYGNKAYEVNAFESSTSTLGANHGTSPKRAQNGLTSRPIHNAAATTMDIFTDFFSSEVFQIVLYNPTTSHRFMRFCQTRACAENIEFLQKVRCQVSSGGVRYTLRCHRKDMQHAPYIYIRIEVIRALGS